MTDTVSDSTTYRLFTANIVAGRVKSLKGQLLEPGS